MFAIDLTDIYVCFQGRDHSGCDAVLLDKVGRRYEKCMPHACSMHAASVDRIWDTGLALLLVFDVPPCGSRLHAGA